MALLSLRDVSLAFGGPALLDQVTLHIERGERLCLLGRNGAGKSTLMKVLAGDVVLDDGKIESARDVRVARLPQEVPVDVVGKVYDVVAGGLRDALTAEGAKNKVEEVLSRFELSPDAAFETLSAGWKRRVFLARALAGEPDLLLLDEPTNHLDIPSIEWLEGFLVRHAPTILFVTHDRVLTKKLATRVIELDRGKLYQFPGSYDRYLKRKEAALADEAVQNEKFDKLLAQEEAWLRQGIKARRTRNEGRVRALDQLRKQRRARRERVGKARLSVQEAERSGKLVIEAKGVSVRFGERRVVDDVSALVMRGDKVGIIGPNGCGKTTLLRALLGEQELESGNVRQGTKLAIAYFDQLRAVLDDDMSVQDSVADRSTEVTLDGRPRHVISYLEDFLFTPDRARSPVGSLSGGERNRLLLAKLFARPSNLLVLDEPTNDLDVETLELLEERLIHYGGTALIVSHDRAFLNNVVTSTLAFEGDGRFREYAGGYDDWLSQRGKPDADEGDSETKAAVNAKGKVKTQGPRKLSYKENKELEALPAQIEGLETEQARIHEELSDPELYKQGGEAIATRQARLAAIEPELGAMYARWEELETIAGG